MSKAKKMSREIEPEDIEDMEDIGDEEMGDMEMDEDMMPNMPNKFWNVQLKPDEEHDLEPPAIPGFEVHITNACFGSNVKPGSRTVVVTKDDENKEVPVCVLLEGKHESQSLNLIISEGLNFSLKGKNVSGVSLTGYIAPPSDMGDMDEGALSMDDEDENLDDEELPPQLKEAMRKRKLQQAREDDNEPLLEEDKKESIEPPSKRAKIDSMNKQQQSNKPNQQQQANKKDSNTSQKQSQQKQSASTQAAAVVSSSQQAQPNANANANAEKPLSKNQKKKQKKLAAKAANENVENPGAPTTTTTTVTVTTTTSNKTNNENNDNNNNNSMEIVNHEEDNKEKMDEKKSPKSLPNQSPKDTPQTNNDNNESNKKSNDDLITMKNGLKYKDIRVGNGEVVKPGQTVNVFYVGQLDDKSIFDKSITPPGFDFVVGKGEVIKGWDEGIKGMKVGGKRRLIIPAHLGYGKTGTDGIPPNATLTFTIEVKKSY